MGRRRTTPDQRRRAALLAGVLSDGRRRGGLSIQDAATAAGLRYGTAYTLLRGTSAGPDFFHVLDLAKALGIPLDQIAERVK